MRCARKNQTPHLGEARSWAGNLEAVTGEQRSVMEDLRQHLRLHFIQLLNRGFEGWASFH